MKFRSGVLALAGLVILAGGCASGGSSGPVTGPGGEIIPESARPRDDEFTRSATLFLTQAQGAENDAAAQERYGQALDAAMNAIAADPGNPTAYMLAGQAQVGVGDYVAADTLLTKAVSIYPVYELEADGVRETAWVEAYNEAIQASTAGDTQGSIDAFEKANLIFRGRPEAMLNLGASYSQVGEFAKAAGYFQMVVDLVDGTDLVTADSARVEGWEDMANQASLYKGQVLAQGEMYTESQEAYRAYLARNPTDVSAMSALAMVTMASGDTLAAEQMYQDMMNQPDLSPRDLYDIGVGLFQSEDYAESASAFGRVLEIAPMHRDALFNRVTALYQADEWDAVLADGESLIGLDPNNPLAYQYVAFAYAQKGDTDTGIQFQERGEALSFTVENTQIQPFSGGGGSMTGQLTNNSVAAGTPIVLTIHFLGMDGTEAGSVDVTVIAPEAGMAEVFRAELDSDQDLLGFYYTVVSGG
jgi:tetratricopeptide (TPR) repeat protein